MSRRKESQKRVVVGKTTTAFFGQRDLAWLVVVLAVAWGCLKSNIKNSAATTSCQMTEARKGNGGAIVRSISPHCFPTPVLNIHQVPGALPIKTCRNLIRAAEESGAWTGHSAFGSYQATRDVSLDSLTTILSRDDIGEVEAFVNRLSQFIVDEFLDKQPHLDGKFGNHNPEDFRYDYDQVMRLKGTPFIIRYDAEDVANVRLHKDNADVSFVVLLSDPSSDFEGGGTTFQVVNETIQIEQGQALVFNGQLVHGAKPVTKGRRYVLSGFTFFSEDFMLAKKKLTLSTMMNLV